MTTPVVLYGTQSNGETLPVQVDATGRLVAEGLQGQQGIQGPPGPSGGSFPLPADPFDGALLGWEDGALTWIDPASIVPPSEVQWANYLTSDCGWRSGVGTEIRAFDGNCSTAVQTENGNCWANLEFPYAVGQIGLIEVQVGSAEGHEHEYELGGTNGTFSATSNECDWRPLTRLSGQTIEKNGVLRLKNKEFKLSLRGIRIDGEQLIDPRALFLAGFKRPERQS